jgi:hypothetical protein
MNDLILGSDVLDVGRCRHSPPSQFAFMEQNEDNQRPEGVLTWGAAPPNHFMVPPVSNVSVLP